MTKTAPGGYVPQTRRVRVTIETDAATIPKTDLIRINTGEGIAVFDPKASHVTVEDLAPSRVWTDGDVVQVIATDEVLRRRRIEGNTSKWFRGLDLIIFARTDSAINRAVEVGEVRILRYQAGEQ